MMPSGWMDSLRPYMPGPSETFPAKMRAARVYYEMLVKLFPERDLKTDWGDALAVGVGTSALKQYEMGRRLKGMTQERAAEILDSVQSVTGLPTDWLWSEEPPPLTMTVLERDEVVRETQRLVKALVALTAANAEASRQQTDEVLGAIGRLQPPPPP